jgi:hypothetical protein
MRIVSGAALVVAVLLAGAVPRPAESQIGGFIKKKAADIAKGKEGEAVKKDDGSPAKTDSCGPITAQKVQDYLRGLEVEGTARSDYDSNAAKAAADKERSDSVTKACRDAETGGTTFRKMMTDGFTGANAPSTGAAVQEQMAKNKATYEEYLDKKCGKDPGTSTASRSSPREAYWQAHLAGAKAAGMSSYCYDVMTDRVIAFCKLPKDQQAAAAEKGLRVERTREWLFTADEARALQPRCSELLPAIKKTGNALVS